MSNLGEFCDCSGKVKNDNVYGAQRSKFIVHHKQRFFYHYFGSSVETSVKWHIICLQNIGDTSSQS